MSEFEAHLRRCCVIPRPNLAALPQRQRTALPGGPTWARKRTAPGAIAWEVYAPHRFGGTVFTTVTVPVIASRSEAARALRQARAVVWGRTPKREAAALEARQSRAEPIPSAAELVPDLPGFYPPPGAPPVVQPSLF